MSGIKKSIRICNFISPNHRTLKLHATLSATLLGILCVPIQMAAQAPPPEILLSGSFYVPDEKTVYYKLGEAQIPLRILQYGERNDIICINLHDNETTSVDAARTLLQTTGGTLVKIENRKQRVIRFQFRGIRYAFDPNRIFSREGIGQSLKENCGRSNEAVIDEIEKFSQRILSFIPDSATCIVALHNNTNEAYSIKSYLEGSDREQDAREVSHNLSQDPDDIILTTDAILFQKMSELGYNAILQDNEHARKDGSLSIWSGEKNRRYINIETQHGKLKQYAEMLEKLMLVLDEFELIGG